ncbi:MAG: response regulator transcription factor [Betaproteobacteria bacterium]|nr:response regulator transcription factor [Betaproteobacteria bacterium]
MSSLPQRIVVLEDDAEMYSVIQRALARHGYRVSPVADRAALLAALEGGDVDCIVLDLGLPGDDGMDVARSVRRVSRVPIIMVTGRASVEERVEGLGAGADDYLPKPFAVAELVARVRAVLRRSENPAAPGRVEIAVRAGEARLDLATRALRGPAGEDWLTEREAAILLALARAGTVVPREALYREAFGREWNPLDRSLDTHVSNLRQKLAACSGEPRPIEASRGTGYRLAVEARIEFAS